ncbi:hypothetical protein L798_07353 [Zootermopsis nevadensis]|uniref:Uncharacterized protein n=1 Tax=Zootermopsis nevadensis TaxID=136037 RepID=A0A067R5H0_ZOONE|nr:hypothetical protein L798_07353 [Zootermopsis nevadensis]
MVMRRICGPNCKKDELLGGKLHNEEKFYSSPNITGRNKSRRMRRSLCVGRMGERRNAYRVLVGKSEGKRLLKRPRDRWEDSIKMDFREIGWHDMGWIHLSQDRG